MRRIIMVLFMIGVIYGNAMASDEVTLVNVTGDRIGGDATYGLDVDVTRFSGSLTTVGNDTPADNYTTPTDFMGVWSLTGLYDGTNWDMQRSFATNVDNVTAVAVTTSGIGGVVNFNYVYDGSTWDRLLGNSTDGVTVNLGSNNDVTVTSGAITETNSGAIKTAVEVIDNAISGNEMQVDVITMPTVAVTGTFYQATQPVSIATMPSTPVTGTFYQATQPVSGTVTANAGTGNFNVITNTASTITTNQVTVDTTSGGVLIKASNTSRKEILIQNIGSTDMFCGNTGVSATTGFKIAASATYIDDRFTGAYYCIVASGSTTAAYREAQ